MISVLNDVQVAQAVAGLQQASYNGGNTEIGSVVRNVIHNVFSTSTRPLSAKMVVLITDKSSHNHQDVLVSGTVKCPYGRTTDFLGLTLIASSHFSQTSP